MAFCCQSRTSAMQKLDVAQSDTLESSDSQWMQLPHRQEWRNCPEKHNGKHRPVVMGLTLSESASCFATAVAAAIAAVFVLLTLSLAAPAGAVCEPFSRSYAFGRCAASQSSSGPLRATCSQRPTCMWHTKGMPLKIVTREKTKRQLNSPSP